MERSRSNNPPTRLRAGIAALGVALSFAIGTGTVHAAGTASGTSINNLSTLNYSVSGVAQPAIGSSSTGNSSGPGTATTFVVDNRVNVTVVTLDSAFVSVAPGALAQVTTFRVTNNGNTVQDFALTSLQVASGQNQFGVDNIDTGTCVQFVETNGTAGYQAADNATFIDELAPDGFITAYVLCDIPVAATNNQHAVVALRAQARAGGTTGGAVGAVLTQSPTDTAGVDIVFGDIAGLDDAARDAMHSARSAYRVAAATLTVQKTSLLICDPFNGVASPKHIPGAVVRWTITISNAAGAASATLNSVTDIINTTLTAFDANLVTGAGVLPASCSSAGTPESGAGLGFKLSFSGGRPALSYPKFFTNAADADGASFVSPNVTVNYAAALPAEGTHAVGELKAGESVTVYFNVIVN